MRSGLARLALALSLLVPVYFAVAALGSRLGLFDWRTGLGVLIVQWGPRVLIGALVIAVVALLSVLMRRPRRGWRSALAALLIPAMGLGYSAWVRAESADIPPIHDVATSPEDPPRFSPALIARRERTPDVNPVAALTVPLASLKKYEGSRFADLADRTLGQIATEAYPGVAPLRVAATPERAFAAAFAEAEARGWTIVSRDAAARTLDATATTFWFGFEDDVAVRVRPIPTGAVIDMRSTSRVGLGDMGANAARIEAFLTSVEARL